MILFLVSRDPTKDFGGAGVPLRGVTKAHAIVMANNRKEAKRRAHSLLTGDPDKYTVEPLTAFGERVFLA